MTVFKWSLSATSNDSIDGTINWREGQSPSSINNSARAMMAAIKRWWLDDGCILKTSGTASAYTLTTNQGITTLTDGATVSARMSVTNGEAPTLAVDGTAAKAITIAPGSPPPAGMLFEGTVQSFGYVQENDEWRLKHVYIPDGVAKTGDKKDSICAGPHPGWVFAAGKTIGNAASNATERANADTRKLFIVWHKETKTQNALYPIQDSSGSASTRTTGGTDDENALADYNANKRLPLPKLNGRVFATLDNLGGASANVVVNAAADIPGGTLGAETHTLVAGEVPQLTGSTNTTGDHNHSVGFTTGTTNVQPGGAAASAGSNTRDTSTNGAHSHTVTVNSGGGGAHNNMPPAFFGYTLIKL